MKKMILTAVAALGMMTANAQQAMETPSFWQNWSIGVDGGVTTPLKGHSFFQNMRGAFGLHVQKQITPVFGLGIEGYTGVNTSSWLVQKGVAPTKSATALDNLYVGAYGTVNLMNLFGGYNCTPRFFEIEVMAGAGWGQYIYNDQLIAGATDPYQLVMGSGHSFFATKAGLNFNFNVSDKVQIAVKPSLTFDMSDVAHYDLGGYNTHTSANYNANRASFNLMASVSYKFGGNGFNCYTCNDNSGEVAALNDQVNKLRGELDACNAAVAAANAQNAALASQLAACQNKKPEVIRENTNTLSSVRYVFYKIGSSAITPDQMPNVEMIAQYLKNHKDSKVVVKGYASQDGNKDFNIKLAAARAESVKKALINKYGIAADRINAEGQGIGHMFDEESWNRVSICILEENK